MSPGVWLLALAFVLAGAAVLWDHRHPRRGACAACSTDQHLRCHPVTPPDLPGERGCCCGQLVPL